MTLQFRIDFKRFTRSVFMGCCLMVSNFFFGTGIAQENNALPPGPARLHGTILVDGLPLEHATIVFFYTRNNQAHYNIFKSNSSGRFTVYVYDNIGNPIVAFYLMNKLRLTFEPMDYMPGTNYSQIFHINSTKKSKLKSRTYRKLSRKLKL